MMRTINKHRIAIYLLAVILGLTSCNMPLSPQTPATATAYAARQTLSASIFKTPMPTGQANATPTSPGNLAPETSPTPVSLENVTPTPPVNLPPNVFPYFSQSGDTLKAVSAHFDLTSDQITAPSGIAVSDLLPVGTLLGIPGFDESAYKYSMLALPDSEVVFGPNALAFDLIDYATKAGGYINQYSELLDGKVYSGPEIIQMVAEETSTNPRLLLAFVEFRSNWVLGSPDGAEKDIYPIGFNAANDKGLYKELMITARFLAEGYYGWRYGTLSELSFIDSGKVKIYPPLNAGTVAIQKLFSAIYYENYWQDALYGDAGFLKFYEGLFGDPWARAVAVEPLLNAGDSQPVLTLPFLPGLRWAFTAGPHATWQIGTPRGALDFAPVTGEPACAVSSAWVTASAPGLVARSYRGTLALDLDGDGNEGTGWVLVYMHVAESGRVQKGEFLEQDDLIGHPSCERGNATGTHVHFTRKYNGEWLATDGYLPMILDGWQAFAGDGPYSGTLVRGYQTVVSNVNGMSGSSIFRDEN